MNTTEVTSSVIDTNITRMLSKLTAVFVLLALLCLGAIRSSAVSTNIVIAEVYGGGGEIGATYRNDYVVLFNRGTVPQSIAGWSLQYGSATAWNFTTMHVLADATIPVRGYYLIQLPGKNTVGATLPTPDEIGTITIATNAGRLALVSSTVLMQGDMGCPSSPDVVDFVGWRSTAACSEGGMPAPEPGVITSIQRLDGGCADSDINAADFIVASPTPRNSASPLNTIICPVGTPPEIALQPQDLVLLDGEIATFSVTVGGTPQFRYQWQFNGENLPGQTAAALTLAGVTFTDAGSYRVLITNDFGWTISSNATLTVNPAPPAITVHPVPCTKNAGASASFTIVATGTTPSYQWYRNGLAVNDGPNINGATSSMLTLAAVTLADAGTYSAIVTNTAGSATSSGAELIVIDPFIATQPQPVAVTNGDVAMFSVSAGGTPPFSYQWRKDTINLTDGGKVSGATTDTLIIANAQADDIGAYSVLVSTTNGTALSDSALLTIHIRPAITTNPLSTTNNAGTTASFTVVATGLNLTYQWYKDETNALTDNANIGGAQSAVLTLTNVYAADRGSYHVVVANEFGSAVSTPAMLAVIDPYISQQPVGDTKAVGQSATLTVGATGTSLAYQWKKDGIDLTGKTGATLALNNLLTSDSGAYTIAVTNSLGEGVVVGPAMLAVLVPPTITIAPVARTNNAGTPTSFTVTANGSSLSYLWHKNGTPLSDNSNVSGSTSPTLALASVSVADAGTYSVMVSNSLDWQMSSGAELVVLDPFIAAQPQPAVVTNGDLATFSVIAGGTGPFTYQWKKDSANLNDGGSISGATTATLTISNTGTSDQGLYSVVVSGPNGTRGSESAMLIVRIRPAITSQPVAITNNAGTTASFAITAEGENLVYQWYKDGTNALTDNTNIGGAHTAVLTLTNVYAADRGTYHVVVTNDVGTAVSVPVELAVIEPYISMQPASVVTNAGETAVFAVSATGTSLAYQWFKDSSPLTGRTGSSLALSGLTVADDGTYTVQITNSLGDTVISSPAILTVVDAPSITVPLVSLTVVQGHDAVFSVVASGRNPTYVWTHNGIPISGATSAILGLNAVQSADAGVYEVTAFNSAGTNSSSATLTVLTPPAITGQPQHATNNFGTTAIFTVDATGGGLSYQWRKDGSDIPGATSSVCTLNNVSRIDRADYTVYVWNEAGNTVSSPAHLSVNDPFITSQPASCALTNGATLNLSVEALGSGTLTYQWMTNGVPLPGATGTSYSKIKISSTDAKTYTVVISNGAEFVTSTPAVVSVYAPLVPKPLASARKIEGQSVTFLAGANGVATSYQWQRNGNPIPGAISTSYTLDPVTMSDNGARFQFVVSNPSMSATSAVATLTVTNDLAVPHVASVVPKANTAYTDTSTPGVTNYVLRVSGKATDNARIEHVWYSINSEEPGSYTEATLDTHGPAVAWTGSVVVKPGTNVFRVYSVDFATRKSAVASVVFFYHVPQALTIHTNYNDSPAPAEIGSVVNANTLFLGNNMNLFVGRTYKLTAVELKKPGIILSNWVASYDGPNGRVTEIWQTNNLKLGFTMQSNLTITANFITNPFVMYRGAYNGLFWCSQTGIQHESAGYVTMMVNSSFSFSGKLFIDGDNVPFNGKFQLNGTLCAPGYVVVKRQLKLGKPDLLLSLEMSTFVNHDDTVQGLLLSTNVGQEFVSQIVADRLCWNTTNQATAYTNAYTFLLPGADALPRSISVGPNTKSFGTMLVSTNGKVTIIGTAADGHPFRQTTALSRNAGVPFFTQLYQVTNSVTLPTGQVQLKEFRGLMMGMVYLETNTVATLLTTNLAPQGPIDWLKLPCATKYGWNDGFTIQNQLVASRYLAPALHSALFPFNDGQRVFSFTDAWLVASGASVTSFTNDVYLSITPTNKFVLPKITENKMTAVFKPKDGTMQGTFTNAVVPGTIKWSGVMLQDYNTGYGSFLNTNTLERGDIILTPKP